MYLLKTSDEFELDLKSRGKVSKNLVDAIFTWNFEIDTVGVSARRLRGTTGLKVYVPSLLRNTIRVLSGSKFIAFYIICAM